MENHSTQNIRGLSRTGLRLWGLLFLIAGMIGRSIFQKELLGIGHVSGQQLLELMASDEVMIFATVALVLQAVETCAIPIFAVLLMDGFRHTASFKKYVLRVAIVAVISEIPYNLAVSGQWLDTTSRNPVFGIVVGLILLYLYSHYHEKTVQHRLVKIIVLVAAMLWSSILEIEAGAALVLVVAVLWVFQKNALYRNMAGVTAAVVCTLMSPFYLASPMGFLVVHFYNEEKDFRDSRIVTYLAYPVLILIIALVSMFAI